MQAGKLRHLITIQRQADTSDSYGQQSDTWSTVRQAWASVGSTLTGREVFTSQEQLQALDLLRVNMRYFSGLRPKDRIAFDGRIFDILNIGNVDERNRELVLTIKEHT